MIKVLTIIGTRPEIIRLSEIIPLVDKYFNQIIVHTGQNYDYELDKVFLKTLIFENQITFLMPKVLLDCNYQLLCKT